MLVNLEVADGTASYTVPDHAMDPQEAFYRDRYLYPDTALAADHLQYEWPAKTGAPTSWHGDRLPPKQVELIPTPDTDGYSVGTSAAFYGTFSSTSAAVDFDLSATTDFYGVIASYTGPIYIDLPGWGLGTISDMVPSKLNLTLLASVKPTQKTWVLDDNIPVLPVSFKGYLKWGVLKRIFAADGETKDVLRARYCDARYQEGIQLARVVSTEALEEVA